jgi:hypothetical protein
MFKKSFTILLLAIWLILPIKQAFAETESVQPIGSLTQLLGMSDSEYQAEIDAGKTPLQIAKEHGMSEKVYLSRVQKKNSSSNASTVKKSTVKKVAKKATKKKTSPKKLVKHTKKITVKK